MCVISLGSYYATIYSKQIINHGNIILTRRKGFLPSKQIYLFLPTGIVGGKEGRCEWKKELTSWRQGGILSSNYYKRGV